MLRYTLRLALVGLVVSWTGRVAAQDADEVARIAIYKDDIPACGAASSPDYLARLLEVPGFSTALLNSEQLADARSLSRGQFDVLVLPYGASFPVKAADNFRKFLRDGGKFFSSGGGPPFQVYPGMSTFDTSLSGIPWPPQPRL